MARHTDTSRSIAGGAAGATCVTRGGSKCRIAPMSEAWLEPVNARCPGDHLVQHRAKGEDVRTGIDVAALQLLGGHVRQGPENLTVERERRRRRMLRDAAGHLGQAEVEQLGAGLGQHHVGRLQVPMHDPGAMREGQALGNLDRAGDRLRRIHRSLRQPRRQRGAVELLHHQEHRAVLLADVVQRADVGMGEGGNRRRFPFEARPPSGVVAELPRQHLDGDAALEPGVPGGVDLAHATGAQRIRDLVGTETRSGRQRHWPAIIRPALRRPWRSEALVQVGGERQAIDHERFGPSRLVGAGGLFLLAPVQHVAETPVQPGLAGCVVMFGGDRFVVDVRKVAAQAGNLL